jgi:hypothetical protein
MKNELLFRGTAMKKRLYFCLSVFVMLSAHGVLLAQDYEYHPALSDNFTAVLGAMRSNNSFKVEADSLEPDNTLPDEEVDFEDSLGVSQHSTFFNGQIRWKFGKARKWSLFGQYFSNNAKGETVLTEDIYWDGVKFGEGSFVGSGVKLAVARLFVGRSFIKNAQNDFGFGIGLHNLDMEAFIEGEFEIDDETTGFGRLEVGDNQPLPNIGGWYNFSPARNWLLHVRVDWISANIGDYDGSLWNTSIGVGYQAWRHVGFDLSWQYFNLNLKVDKTDWQGEIDLRYSGPVLAMTFNW